MSRSLEIATLGRLIETGFVKEVARNRNLINRFETAQWIERSGRKAEWTVREECKTELEKRLQEIWPTWVEDHDFIRSLDRSPYDPAIIEILPVLKHRNTPSGLTNRRNWSAATGISPKHRPKLVSKSKLTSDWIVRFYPSKGMKAVFSGEEISLDTIQDLFTECIFLERMWYKFERFSGELPGVLITCENLGAYIDLPAPPYAMAIYAPGKDITGASKLLSSLPGVPWFHFGDIDPAGIEIAKQIAKETNREFKLYFPTFVEDYLPRTRFERDWEDKVLLSHPIFTELKKTGHRIFQEVFMLDKRLPGDLEDFCQKHMRKAEGASWNASDSQEIGLFR